MASSMFATQLDKHSATVLQGLRSHPKHPALDGRGSSVINLQRIK